MFLIDTLLKQQKTILKFHYMVIPIKISSVLTLIDSNKQLKQFEEELLQFLNSKNSECKKYKKEIEIVGK